MQKVRIFLYAIFLVAIFSNLYAMEEEKSASSDNRRIANILSNPHRSIYWLDAAEYDEIADIRSMAGRVWGQHLLALNEIEKDYLINSLLSFNKSQRTYLETILKQNNEILFNAYAFKETANELLAIKQQSWDRHIKAFIADNPQYFEGYNCLRGTRFSELW